MKPIFSLILVILILFAFSISCSDDDSSDSEQVDGETQDDDDNGDVDSADDDDDDDQTDDDDTPECDTSFRPMVFVHGMLEEGDTFSTQAMRFASNGYCLDYIYTYDWNTLIGFGDIDDEIEMFESYVDAVLNETGWEAVDIMGHSMGGWLTQEYAAKPVNQAKLAHAAVLASSWEEAPAGLPVMNITSADDTIVGEADTPGAENVYIDGLDHLQVATSAETFERLYTFFNDGDEPETTEVIPETEITLSGRIVVFAENSAAPGWSLEIFEFDPATGLRPDEHPVGVFLAGQGGYWGDFAAEPDTYYEFVLRDPDGFWPPIHYYREPFPRSNNKAYFRVFPDPGTLLGLAFRVLPYNDDYALFAWLNINQAVVAGRDTMTVNGIDMATTEMADASITTIAMFFFDANFNGIGDDEPASDLYNFFYFIRFFDMLVPADPTEGIPFEFNGREMSIRNWESRTEGISIAVFE